MMATAASPALRRLLLLGAASWAEAQVDPGPFLRAQYYVPDGHPTDQPPSRGQDAQRCGFVELPERIQLAPRHSDGSTRSGHWDTVDGAQLLTWSQFLFNWDYQTVFYFVNSKIAFKAEAVKSEEFDFYHTGLMLPEPTLGDRRDWDTVALRDCEGVLMYAFRAHKGKQHMYEVYNRLGELVITSERGDGSNGQVHFKDTRGEPVALAQSPMIIDTLDKVDPITTKEVGEVDQWQIWFAQRFNPNSSLVLPQNRWVLSAVIQDRAIRETAAPARKLGFLVFWMLYGLVWVGLPIAFVVYGCVLLFRLVYPERRAPKPPPGAANHRFLERRHLEPAALPKRWSPDYADYSSLQAAY